MTGYLKSKPCVYLHPARDRIITSYSFGHVEIVDSARGRINAVKCYRTSADILVANRCKKGLT